MGKFAYEAFVSGAYRVEGDIRQKREDLVSWCRNWGNCLRTGEAVGSIITVPQHFHLDG
jgi:hypothetical protein